MSARLMTTFLALLTAAPALSPGAVATTGYAAGDEGPNPKTVKITKAKDGHLLTVKIAGLGKGTRIYSARLRAARGTVKDPAVLMTDIEIFAGKAATGKSLSLVGPAYDAFDATDAVRKALAAGGELNLFVKTFPAWRQEATRLEVTYDGDPPAVPSAVSGLEALHRAGQTFLTWKEVSPLVTAEKATWGEYRKALAGAKEPITYRIYAHAKPIDAKSVLQAELLGEVGPLSCWNVNGRNMEYLIGQAMIKSDEMGELARGTGHYMYTWGPNHSRMDRYPLQRLVVDEKGGPLPPGTGLYVASPAKAGKRYYAVVSCKAGVENLAAFGKGNSLSRPVAETVGTGVPVHQGQGLWGPFFDYSGRRQVYVQWAGKPLVPRDNMYFNWSVLVPPGLEKGRKAPLELYFHTGNFSYAKPRMKLMRGSIQIAPHDWPFSGWYGFNEAVGTLRNYGSARVGSHTQRRIIAFLEWAKKTFPIDAERIVLPGSDGAALLALNYPEIFSYVLINKFSNLALDAKPGGPLDLAWGPKCPQVKDDSGRSNWEWAMLDQIVLASRKRDLPLIYCRGYSWGPFVRRFARGKGRFYTAMRKANQPVVADWTWASGQLIRPDRHTGLWRGLDITATTPMPAFANCSTDHNSEGNGQTNLAMGWQPIKETPDAVEAVVSNRGGATFDLAIRRLSKFKVKPAQRLRWEAISAKDPRGRAAPPPQEGVAVVDADGVFVIRGLKVAGRLALTVKVTRAK